MIEQKDFEAYANYSVKVDRYFHCVNVFADNYYDLKYIHDTLDGTYNRVLELEKAKVETDEEVKKFLFYSYLKMQKIHMIVKKTLVI